MVVKMRTLLVKDGLLYLGVQTWKDSIEAVNFEPSDSQEFIWPEEVVYASSAEDVHSPPPLNIYKYLFYIFDFVN